MPDPIKLPASNSEYKNRQNDNSERLGLFCRYGSER